MRSPDLLQPGNSFLLVDMSFHPESHQQELLSRMAAAGVIPVTLDCLLDCVCSHEILPTGGYILKEAGGPYLEGSPKVAAVVVVVVVVVFYYCDMGEDWNNCYI